MDHDVQKVDNAVLALLQLTLGDDGRAWKGFDFRVLDRLYEQGMIESPVNKNKSLVLTAAGLKRSAELFETLFAKRDKA